MRHNVARLGAACSLRLEGSTFQAVDIPIFHLDFLNNRMVIAIIAVLHVVINHGMAVGGIPLVTFLERRGLITGDPAWDKLAKRILTAFFIVTTTVGALTGVGIWFSASVVNPYAIGSLLRVFFFTWFTEWLVFITEVVLIMIYYLTWEGWSKRRKAAHIRLGVRLSIASWLTMALIVSILGFMMDPGAWMSRKTLFSGMFNPAYLPQLAFRTPVAMVMAGTYALLGILVFTRRDEPIRRSAIRAVSGWILAWTPVCVLGGLWYVRVVPDAMAANIPVGLLTQALEGWASTAMWVLFGVCAAMGLIAIWGMMAPSTVRPVVLIIPTLLSISLISTFERVREFVRKPYAIADYLYSNGVRKADMALLQRDGMLTHAAYTKVRKVTPDNQVDAGREVFVLACTRCHTVDGINGIRAVLSTMYGNDKDWNVDIIDQYIGSMHIVRPFMPPFPGNKAERHALAEYLVHLQDHRETIRGAQTDGVRLPPASMNASL